MNTAFEFLGKEDVERIVPIVQLLNDFTSKALLQERFNAMFAQSNYSCLGIFIDKDLIGVCGMWVQMRHYAGMSLEVDHVVIKTDYQSKGVGNQLFTWIEQWCTTNKIEAIELNAYKKNEASHRFYTRRGFRQPGLHFGKYLDDRDFPH